MNIGAPKRIRKVVPRVRPVEPQEPAPQRKPKKKPAKQPAKEKVSQ